MYKECATIVLVSGHTCHANPNVSHTFSLIDRHRSVLKLVIHIAIAIFHDMVSS